MQDHVKSMTEVYDELTAVGETISEEDRVVYLLASLPESYSVLVTALQASTDVPKLAVVTERLLHEETKMKNHSIQSNPEGALATSYRKRPSRCHFCHKLGHFKKECDEFLKVKGQIKSTHTKKKTKMGAFKVTITAEEGNSTDSESVGLVVQHALSAESAICARDRWILDSGATCHMSNDECVFAQLHMLPNPLKVTLGDGRHLNAVGHGNVVLTMTSAPREVERLYAPRCLVRS